jgi:hypothetical protein
MLTNNAMIARPHQEYLKSSQSAVRPERVKAFQLGRPICIRFFFIQCQKPLKVHPSRGNKADNARLLGAIPSSRVL